MHLGLGDIHGLDAGTGSTSPSLSPSQVQALIRSSAAQYSLPPSLPLAVAAHESGFNPSASNCANTNGTCDAGVMQINQTNWTALGLSDPYDPQTNIDAGVKLLAQYNQKYNGNRAQVLCAYQYGPGRCGDPNNLPPLTPGFVAWTDNWIVQNSNVIGEDGAAVSSPSPLSPSGGGLFDTLTQYGIDFSFPNPLTIAAVVVAGLVVGKMLRLF